MKSAPSAVRNVISYAALAAALFAAALFSNPAASDDQSAVAAVPE